MSLAFHVMREDPDGFTELLLPDGSIFRAAFPESFIWADLLKFKLRILFQKPGDASLIFQRVKRTGGIQKHSARLQHCCGLGQNASLKF